MHSKTCLGAGVIRHLFMCVADISDYEAISTTITQSVEWKPIDVLVYNATIAHSSFLDARTTDLAKSKNLKKQIVHLKELVVRDLMVL